MNFCSMKISKFIASAAASLSLVACGGGSTLAGVEGTGGSQQGDVSGFGSIIVNGQRIDVSDAEIVINGVASSESDLRVGHMVTVETRPDGSARQVVANRQLDGPLESVDLAAGTAQALNQPIRVTTTTRFENTNFSNDDDSPRGALNPDNSDLVAVSGFLDADGVLIATLFRRSAESYNRSSSVFDIDGTISQLNTTSRSFMLGDLNVNYSSANVVGELANGETVEVTGLQAEENGTLNASSVSVFATAPSTEGNAASLSGYVAEVGSELQFIIGRTAVDASTATRRDNSGETLMRNSFVRVIGSQQANGGIVASEFSVVPSSTSSYIGNANPGDNGGFKLYGITAETSPSTIYQDNSSTAQRDFNAMSVTSGDKLNIAGYFDRNNQFVATLVERLPTSTGNSVRGTVMNCSPFANSTTIGNVTVNVDSNTVYRDQHGNELSGMANFCATATDFTATATGDATDTELNATEIQQSR